MRQHCTNSSNIIQLILPSDFLLAGTVILISDYVCKCNCCQIMCVIVILISDYVCKCNCCHIMCVIVILISDYVCMCNCC
jgi:hypothetical protein